MDKPNFIKTMSPAQQRALMRWFYGSVIIVSILIASIAIVQVKRLTVWSTAKQIYLELKQETQNFDDLVNRKKSLKEELSAVGTKVDQIKMIERTNKQIVDMLGLIREHISPASLEKLVVNQKNVNITFNTNQIDTLEHLIQTLNQSKSLKGVYLDALQQTPENIFVVTLKGILKG